MNRQETFQVEIELLVYGGDGLARMEDGRAVFVPGVIPGEKVTIRIVEEKERFLRAEVVSIEEASSDRIEPKCPHFGVCGGCHYQHIDYAAQLEYKTAILKDQLTRIGKMQDIPMQDSVASPKEFNYRNVTQFHLTEDGKIGFKKRASNKVFQLEKCFLPQEVINTFWPNMQFEAGTDVSRIEVRQNKEGELLVTIQGKEGTIPELNIDMPISLVHRMEEDVVVLSGNDAILQHISGKEFYLSAGSFFQVNTTVAEKLVDHLLSILQKKKPKKILDIYAGVGLFSKFAASHCEQMIAIESSPFATRDFVVNLDEFDNVSLYEGLAEKVLPNLKEQPGFTICDPPRAGLHVKVVDAIAESKIDTLSYVSCDPSTLARDIKRLAKHNFEVTSVKLFDMFPQTYHFETVAVLERN